MKTFKDVFVAVKDKEVSCSIVPIENSKTGAIGETYDPPGSTVALSGQTYVQAAHCLMVCLGQRFQIFVKCCPILKVHQRRISEKAYMGFNGMQKYSCSGKLGGGERRKRYAAIGSRRAAELYGLEVLEDNITDDQSNSTGYHYRR